MTRDAARAAVDEIRALAESGDHEAAHSREDRLREAFIEHLAKRPDRIGKLARIVELTKRIAFERHCA